MTVSEEDHSKACRCGALIPTGSDRCAHGCPLTHDDDTTED